MKPHTASVGHAPRDASARHAEHSLARHYFQPNLERESIPAMVNVIYAMGVSLILSLSLAGCSGPPADNTGDPPPPAEADTPAQGSGAR